MILPLVIEAEIAYNTFMAKRATGLGKKNQKKSSSHKTKKRLETKYAMLAVKASKKKSK